MENEEKRSAWPIGILAALIAAFIITALLPMVHKIYDELEVSFYTTYTVNSLFDYDYVLYKMLLTEKKGESVKYEDMFLNKEMDLYDVAEVEQKNVKDACKGIRNDALYRLKMLEMNIRTGNKIESLEYFIVDHETNTSVGNLSVEDMRYNDYAYFLRLSYDQDGKMTIANMKDDRSSNLQQDCYRFANRTYAENYTAEKIGEVYVNYADTIMDYMQMEGIRNCDIFWGMKKTVWNQRNEEAINALAYQYYKDTIKIPQISMIIVLLLIVLGMYVRNPIGLKKVKEREQKYTPVLIILIGIFFFIIYYFGFHITDMVTRLFIETDKSLRYSTALSGKLLVRYGLYGIFLFFLFLLPFFLGTCFINIRKMGMDRFISERTLLFMGCNLLVQKIGKHFKRLAKIDMTRALKRTTLIVIMFNVAVVAVIVIAATLGGPIVAIVLLIVYLLFLYFIGSKYIVKLQDKYQKLLKATNAIAEGNLDYSVQEDLGIFEPFKPEIYKIEEGFSKALEEKVKSQKLKSELITNVSHDLKTPLTSIITYVDLLGQEGVSEADRKKYINVLADKSTRLKGLIEDLFEVSKANSNNITLNMQEVDLLSMIKQLYFDLEDRFKEKDLTVKFRFQMEKAFVNIDVQRAFRVYENLMTNILKYGMAGTRVYFDGAIVDGKVMIEFKNVSEQEITLAEEELKARFVRGDVARNTEGNGLGLAIVQSFTEAMGGEFSILCDGDLFTTKTVWKCSEKFDL